MTVARKIDILIEELKGGPRTTTELSEITGFTEDEVRGCKSYKTNEPLMVRTELVVKNHENQQMDGSDQCRGTPLAEKIRFSRNGNPSI